MIRHAAAFVLLAIVVGCGSSPAPRVVRRVGGERRVGTYVSPYSYEWFIRGELALAHGDLERAAESFELARAGPEEDPLVLARLVEVLARLDRMDEAQEVLRGGLEAFPRSEALWLAKGRLEEQRGETARALAAYERAEASAPRSELPPIALASLLADSEAPGRADAVLQRFIRRAPGGTPAALRARLRLALLRNDVRTAARTVRHLMRVAPARADEIETVARAALDDGRPALAAALLEAMPRGLVEPELHVRALAAAGRFDRAEAVLASAPPAAFGGRIVEARLYLQAGMPERADELAELALITEPEPQAWLASGLAKLALGRYAEAAERLVEVPPGTRGFAEARVALAASLRARGLPALAGEVLSRSLEAGGTDDALVLREALAEARLDAGDVDGALEAVAPMTGARGRVARARLLDRARRWDDAARTWAAIPADLPALDARSRARARAERALARGDRAGAIAILEHWLARAPEDDLARERLELLEGRP